MLCLDCCCTVSRHRLSSDITSGPRYICHCLAVAAYCLFRTFRIATTGREVDMGLFLCPGVRKRKISQLL